MMATCFYWFFSQLAKVHDGESSYPPPFQKFHKGQKNGLALTVFIVFFPFHAVFARESHENVRKNPMFLR